MKRRKRLRRRPRHVGLQPSREDLHHGGLHERGTCNYSCGVAYSQKQRLYRRRRVWFRWVDKPGGMYAGCDRRHPDAVGLIKRFFGG